MTGRGQKATKRDSAYAENLKRMRKEAMQMQKATLSYICDEDLPDQTKRRGKVVLGKCVKFLDDVEGELVKQLVESN